MTAELLPLERALATNWPPELWCDVSVVAAVSGGADSVALACALVKFKREFGGPGRLCVAHFNHRLRAEADGDAEFVRRLAGQLGVAYECCESDAAAPAASRGDGIEAAARQERYAFLRQAAERLGARYVATAHTADDRVESILFNILRGTGLAGLDGIPRARPLSAAVTVIRPLLEVRRSELLSYLDARGQGYRVDLTNRSLDFTRNRLRHELLPALREQYRFDIDHSLLRLGNIAADAQRLIERLAEELLDRCLLPNEAGSTGVVRLDTRPLHHQDRHLIREMFVILWRRQGWPLQAMGFHKWDALAVLSLATEPSPTGGIVKAAFPAGMIAERCKSELILRSP
ncbi:MAG: tRNA lysidine(34) synthetase TilS [Pirellulales bacterium]|nr:tRNA lysidine(34) synthetase TilS [Pirellulales bacterium]